MPSPMALSPSTQTRSSFFSRKSKSPSTPTAITDAASYLAAVKQADMRARTTRSATPTGTPALSISSTLTGSTEDSVLQEGFKGEFDDADDGLGFPATPPTSEQVFATVHTEFGHCANDRYRYTASHPLGAPVKGHEDHDPPYYILLSTYISYIILICIGHIRDFFGKRGKSAEYRHLMPHNGYAPLNSDFDSFYTRRLKLRIDDCFGQPVTGVAGRTIVLLDRFSTNNNKTLRPTGTRTRALNISSYNYLGFAQARGGCADAVEESLKRYGVSSGGARLEGGSSDLLQQAEELVAKFVGHEDSLISSMGFATNSTFIPALVGKGCLIISDELNHASIRVGVRYSGASVRMFKHNDMRDLESLLREVISQGQPKTHRPWKKIMLIVEGLYSMEGTMVDLPAILELKKKYKFYVFVDEAHSIGALGPHGRGVCDYYGIDPRQVDILMGTFTKSFGAAGGYVAAAKPIIDRLRLRGYSGPYAEAMTPPVLTQIIASMGSIMGVSPPLLTAIPEESALIQHPGPAPVEMLPPWLSLPPALRDGSEGHTRLQRLAFNARYLHRGLDKLGFITYGHIDSPIVPVLLFNPGKMAVFHRMMKQRKTPIVIVVVAYPATPLVTSRVRFCLSAAHTKEDIDTVLTAVDEIGTVLDIRHGKVPERWTLERVLSSAEELVAMDD